jgi:hypothetical protein
MFTMVVFGSVETAFADVQYSFTTIDAPGVSSGTWPQGINNSGQIVGSYYTGNMGRTYGYLYIDGNFVAGIVFGDSTSANGLNNSGQIVGTYSDSTGAHGFLATPSVVPEPRTLPLLAGCLIGLAMALRRRLPARKW